MYAVPIRRYLPHDALRLASRPPEADIPDPRTYVGRGSRACRPSYAHDVSQTNEASRVICALHDVVPLLLLRARFRGLLFLRRPRRLVVTGEGHVHGADGVVLRVEGQALLGSQIKDVLLDSICYTTLDTCHDA